MKLDPIFGGKNQAIVTLGKFYARLTHIYLRQGGGESQPVVFGGLSEEEKSELKREAWRKAILRAK